MKSQEVNSGDTVRELNTDTFSAVDQKKKFKKYIKTSNHETLHGSEVTGPIR